MAGASPTREAVRALLAEGRSYTEIARELGLSKPTICYHARALGFQADERFSRRYDWAEIQRYYDRLISSGVKAEACEECGLATWRGLPIPLELHHVNGDRHDNRLKNLQLLCPNCHALTENFGVRNRAA